MKFRSVSGLKEMLGTVHLFWQVMMLISRISSEDISRDALVCKHFVSVVKVSLSVRSHLTRAYVHVAYPL